MNPKMTFLDAAHFLDQSEDWIYSELCYRSLPFSSHTSQQHRYFEHATARSLFQQPFNSKIIVFQILKGGTGKTSLAFELAIRASLYGAKVLCIDLDQQANLTTALNQDAHAQTVPVLVDCLNEGYSLPESIIKAHPGIDLIPSRIENSLLDEIIRNKKFALEKIYRQPFQALKRLYDLIIIDCPPTLGQSIAAAALSADLILAPLTPEKFALSGLQSTYQSIKELVEEFQMDIPLNIVLNKFNVENKHSIETLAWLKQHVDYESLLIDQFIRLCPSFNLASLESKSIFDSVTSSSAKEDIDGLTRRVLGI